MLVPLIFLLGAATPSNGPDPATLSGKSVTLPEIEAVARKGFQLADRDGDGQVTRAEIMQTVESTAALLLKHAASALTIPPLGLQMFDECDTNHDGRVSVEEYLARLDGQFARDDADHDGVISPDERWASISRTVKQIIDLAGALRKVPAQ